MYGNHPNWDLVQATKYVQLPLRWWYPDRKNVFGDLRALYKQVLQKNSLYSISCMVKESTSAEVELVLRYYEQRAEEGDAKAHLLLLGYYCNAYGTYPDTDLEKAEKYVALPLKEFGRIDYVKQVRLEFACYEALQNELK